MSFHLKSLVLAILITFSFSRPSHAFLGAAHMNVAVMALGGAVFVAGSLSDMANDPSSKMQSLALRIAGLVFLDGKEGQEINFSALPSAQAQKLGLTDVELENFNSEVDQVNFLVSEVNSQAKNTKEANALWSDMQGQVSAETFSAMQKIARQLK